MSGHGGLVPIKGVNTPSTPSSANLSLGYAGGGMDDLGMPGSYLLIY